MNSDLLDDLALAPSMPGAACRGSTMWDPAGDDEPPEDLQYRLTAAVRICRSECPALSECAAWFAAIGQEDPTRPLGVVAGRLVGTGLRGRLPMWARSA